VIDSGLVGSTGEGHHERRRCSRDTYPESCITKFTSIRSKSGSRGLTEAASQICGCDRGSDGAHAVEGVGCRVQGVGCRV